MGSRFGVKATLRRDYNQRIEKNSRGSAYHPGLDKTLEVATEVIRRRPTLTVGIICRVYAHDIEEFKERIRELLGPTFVVNTRFSERRIRLVEEDE